MIKIKENKKKLVKSDKSKASKPSVSAKKKN